MRLLSLRRVPLPSAFGGESGGRLWERGGVQQAVGAHIRRGACTDVSAPRRGVAFGGEKRETRERE